MGICVFMCSYCVFLLVNTAVVGVDESLCDIRICMHMNREADGGREAREISYYS